jgi:Cellulose biosynthesis protein BcsS
MWRIFLVACLFIISTGTARAQNSSLPSAAEKRITFDPQYIALLGSFDADSIGNRSIYLGGTFAPFSGIYESGFRFRALGDASWYRFVTNENPRILSSGRFVEGGLLAGYGLWRPGFSVTGLVGPVFGQSVNQGLTTDGWGAKAMIEVSARPTDWTMAAGSVSYSTITNNLEVQAKAGLKIFRDVYFGPETKFTWQHISPWEHSQTSIANMRFGAHVSALNVGPVLIGVSGGWIHDRQLGSGYYGSANIYLPF